MVNPPLRKKGLRRKQSILSTSMYRIPNILNDSVRLHVHKRLPRYWSKCDPKFFSIQLTQNFSSIEERMSKQVPSHNFFQKIIFNNHVTSEKPYEKFIDYRNLESYTIGIDRIVFHSYKSIDLNYLYFNWNLVLNWDV